MSYTGASGGAAYEVTQVLCCECGAPIPPNPVNTCAACLQNRYDIAAAIPKQVQQNTCRGCDRFERRDGAWACVEPESKELLALLLKKPRGLANVRLVDAAFVWTEPHSRRLKLRLSVQKEVVANAVLQQTFVVEFVLCNKQCTHCQRREAKDTWVAVVQLRQKVEHKRTFFWLEQLILKHRAHTEAVNVVERRDGLDFYFEARSQAEKLVSFVQTVTPCRYKTSKQLISQDTHTGKGRHKFTYSVEILPICKGDAVWLPRAVAGAASQIARFVVCDKVSNILHLVDPMTMHSADITPLAFSKAPFRSALERANLVEFVVLDIEHDATPWAPAAAAALHADGSREAAAATRRAEKLAEVTVARRADLGVNDATFRTRTHLGRILRVGDYVWGYCVAQSTLPTELTPEEALSLPDVLLVKKSYSERRRRARGKTRRYWKLRAMEKEDDSGVQRGRAFNTSAHDVQYEEFMQDLEEDPSMRAQINLFRDEEAFAAQQAKLAAGRLDDEMGEAEEHGEEEAYDDDFPDVQLEELLDELTLADPGGDGEGGDGEPSSEGGGGVEEEPLPPPTVSFKMPGGEGAQFHF